MPVLRNKINKKELEQKLLKDPEPRITVSFYKYHHIEQVALFRDALYLEWMQLAVLGRTYVADEGINAQISVPSKNKEAFTKQLYRYPWLNGLRLNWAVEDNGKSFVKLDIKIRKKIVADGIDDPAFDVTQCGIHLDAEDFNAILEDPDTVLVDMRNHYESEVGHFKNAILPDVDTFRESLPLIADQLEDAKDKKLVMYCTGGIRCEKASAYMKYRGFRNVFQLNGGIIHYAHQVEEKKLENKFIGKNFVFDKRLGERISHDIISVCHQCGAPADTHTDCNNLACHLLFIQCDACKEEFNGCCSRECKEIFALPEEKQRELRKGQSKGRQVYKKGRSEKLLYKK